MMTPTRFAILILVTAIMLPISPNPSAMPTSPDADLSTKQTLAKTSVGTIDDAESPTSPIPIFAGRRTVDCKCLYIDWWYETPGLWVRFEEKSTTTGLRFGGQHKVIATI